MKSIGKAAVLLGTMLGTMLISAQAAADYNPKQRFSVGGDYYQAWMEGKGNTVFAGIGLPYNKLLPRSFGGGTLYAGFRFDQYLALELGASASVKKHKVLNILNVQATTSTKMRRSSAYLDLVGIFAINKSVDINASLGFGFLKTKIESWYVPQAGLIQGIPFETPGRTILRAGLGASYLLTDDFGFRAKLGWEGTSANRAKVNANGSSKIFKDTLGMSIGIFSRF